MIIKSILPVFILFFLTSATYAAGPEVVAKIEDKFGISALALDEKNDRIYALNASTREVIVINGTKNSLLYKFKLNGLRTTVNMGSNGMAYDEKTGRLIIPGSINHIYFVDMKQRKVVKELESKRGRDAWIPSVLNNTKSGDYVLLEWTGFIWRLDGSGNVTKEIDTGLKNIHYYTLSVDGKSLYVTDNKNLYKVGLDKGHVESIYYYNEAGAIEGVPFVDAKTDRIYVGGKNLLVRLEKDKKKSKEKKEKEERKAVVMDKIPFHPLGGVGMAINPNTRHLFVPLVDNRVAVLDADTLKTVKVLNVGKGPRALLVNEKTNMVYVASLHDGVVTVIADNK